MLKLLRINNIALIPTLDVEFGEGLTLLTGETGAGKSILSDAVSQHNLDANSGSSEGEAVFYLGLEAVYRGDAERSHPTAKHSRPEYLTPLAR